MKEYKINPELEKCLPPLSGMEFEKLKTSIQTQGYDEAKPIVLWKEYPDTIVDGHHRYKICRELGIEPSYVVKSFESLDKAILYTLHRQTEQRNLSAAQLVEIAEQMIPLEEKIKMEEEAKAAQKATQTQDPATGKFAPVSLPGIGTGETPVALPGIATVDKKVPASLPGIPPGETTKKVAGPRKCYHYFEFERFHLRRSRF